jgi:acyl-CoA thioester hydrolase
MYASETQVRVRYGETDQLGIVYHGNYAQYYEIGRVEALRQIGSSYKQLEDSGIAMPVLSMNCTYLKPAYYDDLLTVRTLIRELPAARMNFEYEIYNEAGKLINKGSTELAFLSRESRRPVKAPEWFTLKLMEAGL